MEILEIILLHERFWFWPFTGGWLTFVLLVLIIVLLLRKRREQSADANPIKPASSTVDSPLDILKRRYAKGEISKNEFEQMKQDLEA